MKEFIISVGILFSLASLYAGARWAYINIWWTIELCKSGIGNTHCQDTYERSVNDKLRQKISPFLRVLMPGESTCEHCKWPWSLAASHVVMTSEGSGTFIFCKNCWDHLLNHDRADIISSAYHRHFKTHGYEGLSEEQLDQVLADAMMKSRQFEIDGIVYTRL